MSIKLKPLLPLMLVLVTAPLALIGCGSERKDPALQKATAYVRYLTSRRFLKHSAFEHSFPEKKPSQFVSYLFSDIGIVEWSGVTEVSMEGEQLKSVRIPVPPGNVIITNFLLPEEQARQLLLRGDDSAGVIVAKAYLDPAQPAQFVERFTFPPQ